MNCEAKGNVTTGNVFCNLSRNKIVAQVGRKKSSSVTYMYAAMEEL